MISEAKTIVSRMAAPLYKGCLAAALKEAEGGSVESLIEQLPIARARLARQDAEFKARAQAEAERIAAMAARTPIDKVLSEHRKLKREQQRDYVRWTKRRPDERTARKAHMSNRLDGRARRMSDLEAIHQLLTGTPIGNIS